MPPSACETCGMTNAARPQPLLITLDDVAARLSTPLETVRRWVTKRQLATVKIGRRVLVELVELDRVIAANRRPAID
jgi:excisionase family DNA binding protein